MAKPPVKQFRNQPRGNTPMNTPATPVTTETAEKPIETSAPDTSTPDIKTPDELQVTTTEKTEPPAEGDQSNGITEKTVIDTTISAPEAPVVDTTVPAIEVKEEVKEVIPDAPVLTAPNVPVEELKLNQSEEELYIEKMRESGTDVQKRILAAIETFKTKMAPKVPRTASEGARTQYEFLEHLLWLLEKDYEVFRGGWNLLLVFFAVHHGRNNNASNYSALSEYMAHGFAGAWTKGAEKADAYSTLITLLRATRNKETRKHDVKTIVLEKVGQGVISTKGVSNLKKFYEA